MDLSQMPTDKAVLVIDWHTSGHHLMYLKEYICAFAKGKNYVAVFSPERPLIEPMPPMVIWKKIPSIAVLKQRRGIRRSFSRWSFAYQLRKLLHQIEKDLGFRCERVFFACLYESEANLVAQVISILGRPASGLYMQARFFYSGEYLKHNKITRKVKCLFNHKMLKKIFLLDEDKLEIVAKFSGKPVEHIPDITDYSIDDSDPLPQQLGLEQKKRPIIGLLGHLRPSKGVLEMIAFARSVPDLDVTFLFAGFCSWKAFAPHDEKYIRQAVADDSRIIFYGMRIPAETTYNALFKKCDVIWAAYPNFPHSSNTLVKAAYFRKPVVVADGFLMARRVRQYALGVVVLHLDSTSLRDAIMPMLYDPASWLINNPPRWKEFYADHSNQIFRERLRE